MKVSLIVARGKNGVIGNAGAMPWHIPADLKFFKETTQGHAVIMGRKTFESIGKPLPYRVNVVLSRKLVDLPDPVHACMTIEAAVGYCERYGVEAAFFIGGAEIYRQAMPYVSTCYVTEIDADFEGDALFPYDLGEWRSEEIGRFESGGYTGRFMKYTRI